MHFTKMYASVPLPRYTHVVGVQPFRLNVNLVLPLPEAPVFTGSEEGPGKLSELTAKHALDSAFQIAVLHAARGEADEAFAWMERGYAQRDAGFGLTYCEPSFRPIYNDPRWPVFLKKMGFID